MTDNSLSYEDTYAENDPIVHYRYASLLKSRTIAGNSRSIIQHHQSRPRIHNAALNRLRRLAHRYRGAGLPTCDGYTIPAATEYTSFCDSWLVIHKKVLYWRRTFFHRLRGARLPPDHGYSVRTPFSLYNFAICPHRA